MNPRIIFVIALSAFVLLVVCFATIAVLLSCRKAGIPSNAVDPVFTPSINKRSGKPAGYRCGFNLFRMCIDTIFKTICGE